MDHYPMYIGGKPVSAADGSTFASYEPATGLHFADVARGGADDVRRAVGAARTAFDTGPWPRLDGAQRAAALRRVAARLTAQDADHLANLESRDSGATIRKARLADVPAAAAAFEWCAMWAEHLDTTVPAQPSPVGEYLSWAPRGVIAGIVPWNFPLTLAAWRIAPIIAAGNTCVMKPASFTSLTALELARIVGECGIPPGVVNVVCGPGASVGEELVHHPLVDMATFTGSDRVGAQVLASAAATGKKVRMDLGGKSASLVLDDADLDLAVAGIAWSIFFHNGQICMAGSRAIVHRSLYGEFLALLAERVAKLRLGDPLDERTDLGPLVSRQQVRTVHKYVRIGLDEGARLVCGGARPEPGDLPDGLDQLAYYRPTVLADVDNSGTVAREEIFGPVLAVMPAESDEHAIAIANDCAYGLSAAVWSADPERARSAAEQLSAERVWINDYRMIDLTRPGDGAVTDPCLTWLTNDLTGYCTMRRVYRGDALGLAGRAHFGLLGPDS